LKSEIEQRARFNLIRYSQVWEDADLLIEALKIIPTDIVLSIASAGDNSFALLAQNPQKVYAVDISLAQISCCELRKAMYRQLSYKEHLLFGGVIDGSKKNLDYVNRIEGESKANSKTNIIDRLNIFKNLDLPDETRAYWENNMHIIEKGFMTQGKFERYFELFRNRILPLVHTRREIDDLIAPKNQVQRKEFYDSIWNNRRWKIMFRLFFSEFVMGRLGRDKEFFKYVDGNVADRVLSRAKHALTILDTSENPYLHFIMYGKYNTALPFSLREENYNKIRDNLNKIEFRKMSIEEFIAGSKDNIDAYNLSDIFEYMTQAHMDKLYETMLQKSSKNARFVYWNMMVERECSSLLREKYGVKTCAERNKTFLAKDKAFFYSKFFLDEVNNGIS